jgi:hypothetical protein
MEHDEAIHHIIVQFSINVEPTRAFRILAYHSLGISKFGNQLLMGLFGEAGTGKSRVVNAIRAWFVYLNRSDELVVTATTGTAAFNIRRETLHSALGIAVEWNQQNAKMSKKKKDEWAPRWYLIIDEVSMLDCKMMIKLHNKLCSATPPKMMSYSVISTSSSSATFFSFPVFLPTTCTLKRRNTNWAIISGDPSMQ